MSVFYFDTAKVVSASGNSTNTMDLGSALTVRNSDQNLSVLINATAISGTPSLVVEVQWSHDGTNFASVQGTTDAFTAVTAVGTTVKQFPIKGRYARLKYTFSSTTSITVTITGYTA